MTIPLKEESLVMEVYRATEDDIWDLVAGGEVMHSESPIYRDVPFIKREAGAFVYSHIHDENKCCLIAKNEDGICGALLGVVTPAVMGLELHAHEEILFTLPELRGGDAGSKLIEAFIAWAETKDAKRIWAGTTTGLTGAAHTQLMRRHGFKKAGEVYHRHG